MASLLDTLRQRRQAAPQQPAVGITERARQLLVGRTGKNVGASEIAASNLGERVAQSETQNALQTENAQIKASEQAQQMQASALATQAQESRQELAQTRRFDDMASKSKLNQMLGELERDRADVASGRKKMELEQVGHLLAMGDKQYTQSLLEVGRKQQLDRKMNMLRELEDMTFGSTVDLLRQKLQSESILGMSKRNFLQQMANLDINDAIQIAKLEAAHIRTMSAMDNDLYSYTKGKEALAGNLATKWSAVGGIVKAGAQGSEKYMNRNSTASASVEEDA